MISRDRTVDFRLSARHYVAAAKAFFRKAIRSQQRSPGSHPIAATNQSLSDIFFGTTIMEPGNIAGEYYMTRGHFHARRDMGEVYYSQSGQGILLLDSRDGPTDLRVGMQPGGRARLRGHPHKGHAQERHAKLRRRGPSRRQPHRAVTPSNLLGWLLPIGERHPAANAVIPDPPNTHGI